MKDCIALNESINTLVLSFRDKYFSYDDEDKADIECIDRREDELSYNFQIGAYFFSLQDIYYAMWYDIPEKILFENTNLMYALSPNADVGTLRETFCASMLVKGHKIAMPQKGDILADNHYLFEVGGKNKNHIY